MTEAYKRASGKAYKGASGEGYRRGYEGAYGGGIYRKISEEAFG